MSIIWWTAGVSGIDAPAIRAIRGLQTPQAMTTTSVSMSPWSVRTPRTWPSSTSMPVTSTLAATVSAPSSCAFWRMSVPAWSESTMPTPGRVEAAEDDRLVDERDHLLDLGRGQQARALDAPRRRRGHAALELLHPLRACGRPRCRRSRRRRPSSRYWRALSIVNAVISLEWSVRKMKFEAWPVEPPGLGSVPFSSEDDVPPAEPGEVVGHAVADDAGADDDDPRPVREARSSAGILLTSGPSVAAPGSR